MYNVFMKREEQAINTIQLGLVGFGKETESQLGRVEEELVPVVETVVDKEKMKRRVVPKGTVIYKDGQPNNPFIVSEPFYVLLPEEKKTNMVEKVRIDEARVKIYKDGEYYQWVNSRELVDKNSEYVPLIEVYSSKLINPNKKKK